MLQPSQHRLPRALRDQLQVSKQAPLQELLLHCDLSSPSRKPSLILHLHEYPQEDHRVRPQVLAVPEHHQKVAVAAQVVVVEALQRPSVALAAAEVVLCLEALEVVEEVRRRSA